MTADLRFDPHPGWRKIRLIHRLRPQPYSSHYAQGCRWCDSQGCWLDDYAAEWLAEHSPAVSELPAVPEGALLTLRPGEWSDYPDLPDVAYMDVTVARVHTDTAQPTDRWVWVTGHQHPACGWDSTDRHAPCVRVRVEVAAILECLTGRR